MCHLYQIVLGTTNRGWVEMYQHQTGKEATKRDPVNVDGKPISVRLVGYQINNVEIRNKDSIRVFVEVTTGYTYQDAPRKSS